MVVIPGARTGSKLFELTLSPGSLVISRSDTAARQDVSELELRDFLKKRVDDGSLPMGGGGLCFHFHRAVGLLMGRACNDLRNTN